METESLTDLLAEYIQLLEQLELAIKRVREYREQQVFEI